MVEMVKFPKRCACCGTPIHRVKKMSASWFECPNENCLVNQLALAEEERVEREWAERFNRRRGV